MNKFINKYKYLIALIIPLLIFIGMSIKPLSTNFFGDDIILKTTPIDPHDPFRGEYVILNYEIESIPEDKFETDLHKALNTMWKDNFSKDVFVILKKVDNYYDVDYVTHEKPKDEIYLRATLLWYRDNMVRVEYTQIDKFFVEQGMGRELERHNLYVELKVFNGYGLVINAYPQ